MGSEDAGGIADSVDSDNWPALFTQNCLSQNLTFLWNLVRNMKISAPDKKGITGFI